MNHGLNALWENAAMEQTWLAKVKDSNPEQFLFVTADLVHGNMKRMTAPVSEREIRNDLKRRGMPEAEIEDKIRHARENPI